MHGAAGGGAISRGPKPSLDNTPRPLGREVMAALDALSVVVTLCNQATSQVCHCGNSRIESRPFCFSCHEQLYKVNCYADMNMIAFAMRNAQPFEWRRFDMLIDVLEAVRSGRWAGKPRRRSDEEDYKV